MPINFVRSVIRSVNLVALLVAACVHGQLCKWFLGMKPGPEGAVWVHKWCRRIVDMLEIPTTIDGPVPDAGSGMLAVVSNHLSYLDILVYSATRPFVMVAKQELRSWPLIGWITAQAGTVYVQRRDFPGGQTQTRAEVNALMAEAYRSGLPVIFFPEGTTTNGSEILPFRRGLYNSVVYDNVPMRVAALHYTFDEENPGASTADDVCFWGDADFAPHMFRSLGLRGVHVHVRFGAEPVAGADRFELAVDSREKVVELYEGLVAETALVESQGRAGDYTDAAAWG